MRKWPKIFVEPFCNLSWDERVALNIRKLILTHLEQVLTFNSTLYHQMLHEAFPAGIYLLKVNNRNTGIFLVSLLLTLNIFRTLF